MANVSVCIITYQEQEYIKQTLEFLQLQSLKHEIVIADYDPKKTKAVYNVVKDYDVHFVDVQMKGIGLARRIAVDNARGDYILSFDADCFFDRTDALELMVSPLEAKEVACTFCKVFQDCGAVYQEQQHPLMFELYRLRNILSVFSPVVAFDQAVMFSKVAYQQSRGYPENAKMGETVFLLAEFFYLFGKKAYRFLEEPVIYTSPRRGFKLDYDLAIRGDKTLKI